MPGQSMRFQCMIRDLGIALRPTPHRGSTSSRFLQVTHITVALVIREYDNSKRCSSLVKLIHGTRSSGGGMCRDASPD